MRNHPLTPMTDANLVRVLQAQVDGKVGLVEAATVAQGRGRDPRTLRRAAEGRLQLRRSSTQLSNDDLMAIGAACADMPLVTAGSGIALGLPQNFRRPVCFPMRRSPMRCLAVGGLQRGGLGQLLDRNARPGGGDADAASRRSTSIRCDLARGKNVVGEGAGLGATGIWHRARC